MALETLPTELAKEIENDITAMKGANGTEGALDTQRARLLLKILSSFEAYGKKNGPSWKATRQFQLLVQDVFGIEKSRAYDYIKIAKHPVLKDLEISISRACLLSRYKTSEIQSFLAVYPQDQLNQLTCRKLASLLQETFPRAVQKKRSHISKDLKSRNTQQISTIQDDTQDSVLHLCDALLAALKNATKDLLYSSELNQKLDEILKWKNSFRKPAGRQAA